VGVCVCVSFADGGLRCRICVCVCMCMCVWVCMHVCVYSYMCVCVYVCVCVSVFVYVCLTQTNESCHTCVMSLKRFISHMSHVLSYIDIDPTLSYVCFCHTVCDSHVAHTNESVMSLILTSHSCRPVMSLILTSHVTYESCCRYRYGSYI